MNRLCSATLLVLLVARAVAAQDGATPHLLSLNDDESGQPASLEDISWLAGAWEGEAFGGTFEEVWSRPAAGSMVGLFKLMHDDASSMYEIQLITEESGSLVWKVKHFNSDFSAWEEKTEYVSFPLVKVDSTGAYFDGLTLIRTDSGLDVYLAISEEGLLREEKLVYRPAHLRDHMRGHE